MSLFAPPMQRLVDELSRLPGIGPKSAQRIAYHLLESSSEISERLSAAIAGARSDTSYCTICFHMTDQETCEICRDPKRNQEMICVVEEPRDVIALERTHSFHGLYHVLGGAIAPNSDIGPDELRIKELVSRVQSGQVREVVVATNATFEGEATSIYLAELLKPAGVSVSRLASGIPVGLEIEYADEVTLGRALEGRRQL